MACSIAQFNNYLYSTICALKQCETGGVHDLIASTQVMSVARPRDMVLFSVKHLPLPISLKTKKRAKRKAEGVLLWRGMWRLGANLTHLMRGQIVCLKCAHQLLVDYTLDGFSQCSRH